MSRGESRAEPLQVTRAELIWRSGQAWFVFCLLQCKMLFLFCLLFCILEMQNKRVLPDHWDKRSESLLLILSLILNLCVADGNLCYQGKKSIFKGKFKL